MFLSGQQYTYRYEGQVSSRAMVAPADDSTMALTSTVIITANTPCDLKMTVVNMYVEDVPPEDSQWFREAVEQHPLHFSYQGGRIEHLCPHNEELAIATNFKRGILSAFQTSVSNLAEREEVFVQESDVCGECETRYEMRPDGHSDNMIVTKTKLNCRTDTYLPYISHAPYTSDTFNTHLPFFRNNQTCQLVQKRGMWSQVECSQTVSVDGVLTMSVDRPPLASMTVSSILHMESGPSQAHDVFAQDGHLQRRESLRMDLEGSLLSAEARQNQDTSTVLDQIADTLEDLQISMKQNSGLEDQRPHIFAHLVNLLGSLKQEVDMDDVWDTYGIEEGYRELVRDALLVCESEACVHLVTRLAMDNHPSLPPTMLTTWLAGLHFRTHADRLTIAHIMELSQNKLDVSDQAVMAASSLVHTVCQQEPHNCFTNAQPFLEYVKREMGSSCGYGETRERQHYIKLVLRALGNAGVLPEPHFSEKCYTNKILIPELRVAALQAYRRIGCSHSDAPWKILEDVEEEVEVRVAAYLALVPCATHTPGFFARIKKLLEKEDVNQVGSYIWTHVRNLARQPGASEQSRQLAKLAAQLTLQDKFNINGFRSSRNYHYGHYSETVNLGGSIVGDVIFNPSSYLPQQAALNLTLDLLDKSFNILELGGDFKGLEKYIESFFGKEGYFENERIRNILESLRPKRDIHHEKIDEFQRLHDEATLRNELMEPEEETSASVYLRVFGNEVVYLENALKSSPLQFLQQLIQEFSSPKSFKVVDQELLSPTLLGFPLRLKLNATGSVTFNREGTLLIGGAKSMRVEGKVSPSAVVSLDETLTVDGYTSSSGIRRRTTQMIHTDFGVKFALENGQMVDAEFDIPGSDLVKMSSAVKVMFYKNLLKSWEEPRAVTPVDQQQDCSSDILSNILGLRMCTSSNYGTYVAEGGAFVGEPYERMLQIAKTDTFENYIFSLKKIGNNIEALFDTPGSSIDRRISFQISLTPDGAGGNFVLPGKSMQGQFENTPVSKRLSLQYLESSELQGEFEVSLHIAEDEAATKFTPKLLLSLKNVVDLNVDGTLEIGAEVFTLECNFMSSLQTDPGGFLASWEHNAGQHTVETKFVLGPVFWTTSGTFLIGQDNMMLEATCRYGSGTVQPHTLSVNLNSSHMVENGEKLYKGFLFLESSQAEANLELEYDYRPGYAQANTKVTLHNTQVSSHLLAKNIDGGEKKDFEVTVTLVSAQLDVNYLGQLIYKVSDDAFQAEAEVILGSLMQSKMSITYLLQYNPLHLLAGLHLQFNDFIIQAGYNIDLSEPDRTQVIVSSTVGGAAAGFHLEADYNRSQPFNTSVEVFAGYETHLAGFFHLTSSDLEWEHFSGKTNLRWFDGSYEVQHEALWSLTEKQIKIFHDDSFIKATVQSSPSLLVQLLIQSNLEESEPDFQVALEKQEEQDYEIYQAQVTAGTGKLMHLTASYNKDQTFSGSVQLLESLTQVYGRYSQPKQGHLEGSAQITITIPSGQSFTSDLSLSYYSDSITQDLKLSHVYDGGITEGHLKMQHRDGWFTDDTYTLAFTLTTPFAHLQKVRLAFENHGDPALTDFFEAEWGELKVRGEAQLSDAANIEVKLLYEDGGTCDSHIHIYHKYDDQESLTGVSVGLTQAHDPWAIQVITILDQSDIKESLVTKISFQSPLLSTPFQLHGMYSVAVNQLDFKFQVGLEEETYLTFSGKNYIESDTEVLLGTLEFDTPWTEPMLLNVTNTQHEDCFNVALDLQSSWDPILSVAAEFSYSVANDTKAHFYLSHDHLQVVMEMVKKLTDSSLSYHFQGSANTVRLTSHLNTKWDEDFIPITASGQFSATNLFDHKLDLTLSHAKESDILYTQLFGSWDNQTLRVVHKFDFKQPLEWISMLQLTLPYQDEIIETELLLNAQSDLSSLNLDFSLKSPWSKDFRVKVEVQMTEHMILFEFDMLNSDSSIIKLALHSNGPFHWYQSDLSFKVNSFFSDHYDIKWMHNFLTENLILIEVSHGTYFESNDNGFFFKGTSNLLYNQGLYEHDFTEFDFSVIFNFPSRQLDFKSKVHINSQLNGEFEVKLNDYIISINSAIFDGIVFWVIAGVPEVLYETELRYNEGNSRFPDLHFRFTQDRADIFAFTNKFNGLYPKFDAMLTISILMEANESIKKGQLRMMADMTRLQDYAFKGSVILESDFEGFKKYQADLDTDMNTDLGLIDGHLIGSVHINDWHYQTSSHGLLNLGRNISLEYRSEYDLIYGEQLFDRKKVSLLITCTTSSVWQGEIIVHVGPDTPQWSFVIYYSRHENELKSSISPGKSEKYELSANIVGNRLIIDVQIIGEDGSEFQVLKGNINWNIRKRKKQFTLNMNSDYTAFRKIAAQCVIQHRRGLAANVKFRVNEENFIGSLRYISQDSQNSGKIILKVENDIYMDFKADTIINLTIAPDRYESDLMFDLNNQKGWLTANMKASLSEYHLQFKTPFAGYENVDLTMNVNLEDNWGVKVAMQAPKVCVNLEGTLDKSFTNSFISVNIKSGCTGKAILNFSSSYSFEKYHSFDIASYCYIHNYGLIYKFETSGKDFKGEADFTIEGTIRGYDAYYNSTHFFYRHSFMPTNADIILEINQRQLLSFQYEYDIKKEHSMIDVIYSHLLFGSPLNIKFTAEANTKETSVIIEMLLTTDTAFEHADLYVSYDYKDKNEGTFTLSTTLGDAEGKVTFQETENSFSIKADMISSIHSFHEYHFQFDQKSEGDSHQYEIVSMQDDIGYHIKFSLIREDSESKIMLNLITPFKKYENFDIGIVYPKTDKLENPYQAYINVLLSGNLYGIDINHNHQESWRSQMTELRLSAPELLGNASVSVMYDVDGQAELQFSTFQGGLGMKSTWQHLETSFISSLNIDLTLIDCGEYIFYAEIPLIYSEKGEVRFERHETNFDFIGHVVAGGRFTYANISFVVVNSEPVPENPTYMLSYEFQDSLQISGEFNVWEAMATLKFEGNETPVASGTLEVMTNIEGYEAIDGSWDIKQKDHEYFVLMHIDMKDQRTLAFRAIFDIQPEGVSTPWDRIKLDVLFESPFTLTHHIQAECQLSTLSIAASYLYGLDTFQVKFSSEFKKMEGSLLLTANIPVRGVSTVDFNLSYILKESYSLSIAAAIEETDVHIGMEITSDGMVGSVISSITSPFFMPMKTTLNWSFTDSLMLLEATYDFLKYTGGLKMSIEYTSSSRELEFYMRTPFELFSKFDFQVHYSFSESNQMHITADLSINDHTFKIELVFINSIPKINLEISGFMEAFGAKGSVWITFAKTGNVYEGKITSEMRYYKPLDFIFSLDTEHIKSILKYGTANVLVASLNFSHIDVQFIWKEHFFLNLTANLTPANNGYLFFDSSETKPLTIYFSYSHTDGHEGSAHVTVGEKEYNIRSKLYAHKRKSALEFRLDSSNSPHIPILMNATYDIKDFLKGRMNSMMDIASISFEWGEQFHLSVTGMRNRNHAKVNIGITTPLKFLPQLRFGYDGEFSLKKLYNTDLTFTAFVEWPERITLTGFFQYMDEKVTLHLALATPYSGYEKLSVSFKFNPGNVEAGMVFNNDEWNILGNYELSPTFSLTLSAKTPINGYEMLSLTMSASLQEGIFTAQAELSRLNTTAVRIQIQAEMWSLEIHINTPWKHFEEVLCTASLKTESEELMCTAVLQLNEKKIEITLIYSPVQFQLVWRYVKNSMIIGLLMAEYSTDYQDFRFGIEVQAPFKSFTSLKVVLHLGPQDKEFIFRLHVNDLTYIIEGLYSVSGGKFVVDIPVLRNFMWKLEAHDMWMHLDTQASFNYLTSADPITVNLTCRIQPVNKEASLDISFEAPNLRLESLDFSMTASYASHLEIIDASSTLFMKVRNEEASKHELNLTSSVADALVSLTIDLESDYIVAPYRIKGKFSSFNVFLENGILDFVVTQEGLQMYKLFYETVFSDEQSPSLLLALESPEWVADIQVSINGESLNVSFSYPEYETKHSLLLNWSEDFNFEKFTVGAEIHSPYLDEDKFRFDLNFMVQEKFTFALDSVINHGSKNINIKGILQYTDSLSQIKFDLQVKSNWIGMHSMEAVIQWLREITVSVKLNSLDKEHSVRLHIDSTEHTLSLICNSPWIPYENIKVKGNVSSNFEPSNIKLEGYFSSTIGNNDIVVQAVFMSEGIQNTTSYISVLKDKHRIFHVSGSSKIYSKEGFINISIDSDVVLKLDTNISFILENIDERDIEESALYYLFDVIYVKIADKKYRISNLKIHFYHNDYYFNFNVELDIEQGHFKISLNHDYSYFFFHFLYDFRYAVRILFKIETSLEEFQDFKTFLHFDAITQKRTFEIFFHGRIDYVIQLNIECVPDSVMGWSILSSLITPFKGYEKFVIQTPQFHYRNNVFTVMLEYPGGKAGISWRNGSNTRRPDLQFSIYLPFEEYEIISLQYCLYDPRMEIRVGKVGISLGLDVSLKNRLHKIESKVSVNEYSMKTSLTLFQSRGSIFKMKLHFDFSPKELCGIYFFTTEFQYHPHERIYFAARNDQEELLKAHVAWGSKKVFSITTPKRYPGYLILNLESAKELEDYQLQVGLTHTDGPWEIFGFHLHQEILEAGRHLSLSGEASESQFYVEGTFSLNHMHCNQSLILELNRKRVGYKVQFQREPGLFNSLYTGDMYMILPTQTVHYETNAVSNSRKLDISSSFAWNELDSAMPPLTFKLNYNDNSLFKEKRHYLKAVFSHPDIKDVILQGNITQSKNLPLYGVAELCDGNSPERSIVMVLNIQPFTNDEDHILNFNISQPSSGFALSMDAQITKSVLTKGDYTFRYWNLTEKSWEDLQIVTAVDTTDHGYDFTANIHTSQRKWGYSYRGDFNSWDHSAILNIQGISKEYGEFWKLGTIINKHLPQLLVSLDVGKEDGVTYEGGRVRIGFHSPLEIGATLDHQRFDEWRQDIAVGLKLKTTDILQFFIEFDPSLDYRNEAFWAHLTSPADKIWDTWWRDVNVAASAFKKWILAETPAIIGELVDKQTMQAVWERETANFNIFIGEVNAAILDINENIILAWTESVQPLLESAHNFTMNVYSELEPFLQDLSWRINLNQVKWETVTIEINHLQNQLNLQWTQLCVEVVTTINDIMYQLVRTMNLATGVIRDYLTSADRALRPYLGHISETFTRYGLHLDALLDEQCWSQIYQKFEQMKSAVVESVNSGVAILKEFLQLEEYYSLLSETREFIEAWRLKAGTVVQDGVSQLQKALQESPMLGALHQAFQKIQNSFSALSFTAVSDFMDHGLLALGPYATAATEEVLRFWGENIEVLQRFSTDNIFFSYINAAAGNVYERILLMWQSWREEERHNLGNFEQVFLSFTDAVKNLLGSNNFFTEESFVYEPDVYGKIIYNQHLPVPWTSFLEAPQWYRLTNVFQKESPVVAAQRVLAGGMDGITSGWEALHLPGALSLPFPGTATIMGQHITTFDLRHYQFLGPCSYLLTRDFVGGDFSVVGVYHSEAGMVRLESLVVQGTSTNITLHVDGTMDVTEADAEVYTGSYQSGVKMDGLLVTCNKMTRGCSITVSGKYFGRVAGLLGNYNYEPSDDYHGPDGARVHNAAELATKWAVSRKPCYQANQATHVEDIIATKGVYECSHLFLQKASYFSSCFHLVDPQPYFWHCINGHNQPEYDDKLENSGCIVAESYRAQCTTQGVHLPSVDWCQIENIKLMPTTVPSRYLRCG
ncbi:uncharacterized protein [Panulirus ornatus]|uniref:uncharacterized protein n=1 Tax=Panulirus ornatus TaxID=150431 RepID=UPI003A8800F3